MNDVVAVIPTFRPEAQALKSLVSTLTAQSLPIIISDDASPTTFDCVLNGVVSGPAKVVRHRRNAGIARGLNDGLSFAQSHDASWVLTVDQDTVVSPDLVTALVKTARQSPRIGVVGVEVIRDASGDVTYPTREADGLLVTEEVFQTASLWSVRALHEIGGFDERLGLDAVDAAACLRLREHGYLVALAPRTHVEHRLGSARQVRVLGRTVLATGHRPERRESMMRNRIALAPAEFRQSPLHGLRTIRRVGLNAILGSTIETDRWANTKASVRGLFPKRGR